MHRFLNSHVHSFSCSAVNGWSVPQSLLFGRCGAWLLWVLPVQPTAGPQWPECRPIWTSCSRCKLLHTSALGLFTGGLWFWWTFLTHSLHLSLVLYTLLLYFPADGGHQLWLSDCFQACGIWHRRILDTEVQGTLLLLLISYMCGETCTDLSLEKLHNKSSQLVETVVK